MAAIPTSTSQLIENKIKTLNDLANLLDQFPQCGAPHDLTSIILITVLGSAQHITNSIPEDYINRPLLIAFHKFYNSLSRVIELQSPNPSIVRSKLQPLLEEISKRINLHQ